MPNLRFRATRDRPTWVHRKGGREMRTYSDGREVFVMAPPIILQDGDIQDMDDFQSQHCLSHFPANFALETDAEG